MPDLLDGREAARYLGITRTSLWKLMATGRLRWVTIDGLKGRKFRREDLDALIRDGEKRDRRS